MNSKIKDTTCELCGLEVSKYLCPRCGVSYCSLPCYRSGPHQSCSESFYRDCVTSELKSLSPKDDSQMKSTLQRFHQSQQEEHINNEDQEENEEDLLDSDDEEPLAERLAGIDLDDADKVWSALTEEEKSEFGQFVSSVDKVEEVVEEWVPWWEPQPVMLVQEVHDENKEKDDKNKNVLPPTIWDKIPPLNTLTKVKPNESNVSRGLTNVVAAYVWTSRLYNGEFLTYPNSHEVLAALVHLSSFLSKDAVFTSFQHALADVSLNACHIPELFDGGPALQATLSKDVFHILEAANHHEQFPNTAASNKSTLSALSECYRLVDKVLATEKRNKNSIIHHVSKEEEDNSSSAFSKKYPTGTCGGSLSAAVEPKLMRNTRRKLHYLLAFANEHPIIG